MQSNLTKVVTSLVIGCASAIAVAQVKVGVIVSATGPAASIGVPERRAVDVMPREAGGRSIEYFVMDDATDTNLSVKAARKLMGDQQVDVVIGARASAPSLAVVDVAAEFKAPLISMASSSRITSPVDEKKKWAFKTVMDESLMVDASLKHLAAKNVKKLAFIGAADAYGDVWVSEVNRLKSKHGIDVVSIERFASGDVTVLAQIAKILAERPDAVLIAAAGTPAALPHKALKERGYKGLIVQTFGATAPEVIKIGGKDMEGALVASTPGFSPSQMAADDPIKLLNDALVQKYEKAHGTGSFSPYVLNAWTAWQLLENALKAMPASLSPGTPEFRVALRGQIEKTKDLATASGVVSFSPQDHMGFDLRSTAMYELRNGKWLLTGR